MDYDFVVIGGGIVGIAAIALAVDFSKAQSLLFEHEICSSTFNWFKISGASQGDLCAILTPQARQCLVRQILLFGSSENLINSTHFAVPLFVRWQISLQEIPLTFSSPCIVIISARS
jgi:hypothetical protein